MGVQTNWTTCLYVLFFFLVLAVSLIVPLVMELQKDVGASRKVFQAANTFLFIHEHIWLPALFALIAVGIHSVRTSHRIAGPLLRIRHVLRSLHDGKVQPPPSGLRKGDYLQEEFSLVNGMQETISSYIHDVSTAYEALHEALDALVSAQAATSTDAQNQQYSRVLRKSDDLKNKIDLMSLENNQEKKSADRTKSYDNNE